MPRTARRQSITGIYHVMIRGVNQQQIFEEKEDYNKFLQILSDCKKICKYELYAYCIMGNHVHLLIKEKDEPISKIMKRISCRFVAWYNRKYERTGHLLQGRFHSEVIETDRAFKIVAQYIHQNPVKANLVDSPSQYPWSSFHDYKKHHSTLVSIHRLIHLLGTIKNVLSFFNSPSKELCLDTPTHTFICERRARKIIYQITKCKNASEFQKLNILTRNNFIKKLIHIGLSIRQINRLCGVSRRVISQLKL